MTVIFQRDGGQRISEGAPVEDPAAKECRRVPIYTAGACEGHRSVVGGGIGIVDAAASPGGIEADLAILEAEAAAIVEDTAAPGPRNRWY